MYSVIIPTYNGAKKISTILSALENQTDNRFEVIVVIDGSTDDTVNILKNREWSLDLVVVEQQNKGRAAARNKGVSMAKHDLVIFFDDDMRPLTNCVELHYDHHCKFPGSILTGGATEDATENSSEILKFKAFLSDKWVQKVKYLGAEPMQRDNILVTTQNFSLPKKIFDQLGGFDERLSDAEDYDLAVRAFKINIPLYYNYAIFAWHDDPLTTVSYIKRQRQYTKAYVNFISIHPEYINEGFIQSPYTPTGIKRIIFRLFCFEFWVIFIESNLLGWLPTKIKYKLYDYIIMANGVFFPELVTFR